MKKIILFIILGIFLGGLIAYGTMRYIAGQRVEGELAGFVEKTPAIERIIYDKVRVGVIRPAVHLEKIHIKLADYTEPMLIDQIDLMVQAWGHSIPLQARAEIRGIHLNVHHDMLQMVGAELQSMGYDDVTVTVVLDYHYDPAEKRLDLKNLSLHAVGMGRLQFELTLTNIDLPGLIAQGRQSNITSLLLALPTMGIAPGRLTYHDDSFAQRLFQLNIPPSDQKQSVRWHRILARILAEEKDEQIRQNIISLQNFINHPDSITVTMRPASAVPLLRLFWIKKPVDLLELFNVQITT